MISHYWWKGAIERADEVLMMVKTRASLVDAASATVKELHSYETPAIMVLAVEQVDPEYNRWIVEETSPK
jgi:periplasmic divalent cation tolerance protein